MKRELISTSEQADPEKILESIEKRTPAWDLDTRWLAERCRALSPKSDREKLTLRLPPEVHLQIKALAAENDRSLNAEIVARLRTSLSS